MKTSITLDIILHPIQIQIITAMREGMELETETLRSVAEWIQRQNLNDSNRKYSPQKIKHHIEQLVKLGVVNIVGGKYVNNDTYGQSLANRGYHVSVADIKSLWYSLNLTNKNKKEWDKELQKFSLYIQDLKN